MVSIIICITAPTTLPTFIQTCDVSNGYTLLNDNQGSTTLCVKVHSEAKLWENARTQCRQEGGDLVVLDSPLKLHLIQTELTSMGLDGKFSIVFQFCSFNSFMPSGISHPSKLDQFISKIRDV
ncbi:hypothetical protein DPMN_144228 [Dreissena polymorpha]|uniref:C-type lectin domain-containing protein n=1 Tax=Dreissena polymorpha TaxID=45954 RepID=A0A9D4GF16_DREPO|nr:hypothetical protein DPMN_144075 [Dreissena polymorpha]KAH3815697.1 hypothetical protein DPMN_144228 [Dreissena polymorpha]